MSHDPFRLTPLDVRKQEFRRSVRGYEPAGVDEFRERVADELDRVLRERAQLDERLRNFHEQLRAFREREKAMNEALVSAQQLRVETKESAQKQADIVIREAEQRAEEILRGARRAEQELSERTRAVERQFNAYVAGFRALLERQLAELDAIRAQYVRRDGTDDQ